jgi:hypothetical protein
MATITYTNGTTESHASEAAALAALRAVYPALVTERDQAGDSDRLLVWADEASAENDPGTRAIAVVTA